MKSRRSFKFGLIGSCTMQLPALERLEKTYNWRNVAATRGTSFFYEIFFIPAGNKGMRKSMDELKL